MKISFHGGAQEVTGACYLIETRGIKVLIDCGLFQGGEECSDLNFGSFRFDPPRVEAVLVSHAHLDHIGRIPKLIKEGFRGKIYSTAPTRDLARLLLEDSLALTSKKDKPLFGAADLEAAFKLWKSVSYGEMHDLGSGSVKFQFREAGHILGSAMVEIWAEGKHLLFTGDLGNAPSILLPPPDVARDIEYLIIEATYGSRVHESDEERRLQLERVVEDVSARGGTLMIPVFATERTQDVLLLLNHMLHFNRIPDVPVFVDSPLAIKVTEIFERYLSFFREDVRSLYIEHPNLFRFKKLRFTETVGESKRINDVPPPKVILAGSGMMNGGRILHHLRRYLGDPKSILLVVGYQAAGSLGRRLIDGERLVKIFGEDIPVEAEIRKINGLSAHADNPQLFSFVQNTRDALKRVFVVQGEEAQTLHFMQEVRDRLGVQADAPTLYQEFEI